MNGRRTRMLLWIGIVIALLVCGIFGYYIWTITRGFKRGLNEDPGYHKASYEYQMPSMYV